MLDVQNIKCMNVGRGLELFEGLGNFMDLYYWFFNEYQYVIKNIWLQLIDTKSQRFVRNLVNQGVGQQGLRGNHKAR